MVGPFLPDAEKLAAVRDALPAVSAGIYLNTPVVGPLPAETARAMADIAEWELTTGRAHRDRAEDVAVRVDEARAGLAAILGTDVDAIVLTHGIEDALRRVIGAVDWRRGERILVVSDAGAKATLTHLRPPVADGETDVVELSTEPDASDDAALVASVEAGITAGTRLVVCPHVSVFGQLLPVDRLARVAHEAGAMLLVDGSQAAGAIPVSVEALGADLYVVPAWTWLLGPEGIAGMAAAGDIGRRLAPRNADGGFHLPSVVGMARSCGWLSMYVGLEWIFDRSAAIAAAARQRLGAIPGVRLQAPGEGVTPSLAFRIDGWDGEAALDELGARVFALASVIDEADAIRIGPGFFTTEDEIDRFAAAVELLATHTPENLPPRRQLTIIGGDR